MGRKDTEIQYYCQLCHWNTTVNTNFTAYYTQTGGSPCDDLAGNRPQMFHVGSKYKTPFVLSSTLKSLTHHGFPSEFNVVLFNYDNIIVRFLLFLQGFPQPQYFWFPKNMIKPSESLQIEYS